MYGPLLFSPGLTGILLVSFLAHPLQYKCSHEWHTSSNCRVRILMTSTSLLPSNKCESHSCPTHDSQVLCSERKLEIVHRYNYRICLINVRNSAQVTLRYVFGTRCSPMCVKATLSLTQLINVDKCHDAAKKVWYEVCRPSNTKNNHVPRRSAGRQGVPDRSR
jgi:hypothetical protein